MSDEEAEKGFSAIGSELVAEGSSVEYDEELGRSVTVSNSEDYGHTGEEEYETGSASSRGGVHGDVQHQKSPARESSIMKRESRSSDPGDGSFRKRLTIAKEGRQSINLRRSSERPSRNGSTGSNGPRASTIVRGSILSRRKTVQIAKDSPQEKQQHERHVSADDDDSGEWACPLKPPKPRAKVIPPPYQLWPVRKFNHYVVTKLIAEALPRFFANHAYHPTSSMENLRMALTYIIRKVYQLRYDRRKLVVVGRLHEDLGQSSLAIARFLWSPETDAYAHYTLHKPGFIVGVVVFAIYMD